MGLLDRHCLLFHYTDKKAVEVKRKKQFLWGSIPPTCTMLTLATYVQIHDFIKTCIDKQKLHVCFLTSMVVPFLLCCLQAFDAISQLQSNEVFASKYKTNSIFGYGVYSTSKAPHEWPSKKHLLLNNYFPARKTWMEKRKGKTDIEWPADDVLHSDKSTLTNEDWDALLNTKWADDFLADLEKTRPGAADYCLTIVCDKDLVKD